MIATALYIPQVTASKSTPALKPLSRFPAQIDDWVGQVSRFDQKVYDVLGVDDSVLCSYYGAKQKRVELYVGFYESQKEGELIHSPKNCLPGAGWKIVQTALEPVTVEGRKIKTIKLVMEKAGQRQVVLYWFQSRGRYISSEYLQKIYLVVDSITKGRTDGSFVRLITPVGQDGMEGALETLKGFAERIIPILNQYLPS